jgi:predicted O-methyltransferase YrrM
VGEQFYDERVIDRESGNVDTLPVFRQTIRDAGLDDVVVAIVGRSAVVAAAWGTPLGLVFIDGGHSNEDVNADYEGWAAHVGPEGLLAIHDVFEDPADGGREPYEVYRRALESDAFEDVAVESSLRVLQRVGDGF